MEYQVEGGENKFLEEAQSCVKNRCVSSAAIAVTQKRTVWVFTDCFRMLSFNEAAFYF